MVTVGYLSFGPIEKQYVFCDVSVREKDWRSRARGAKATSAEHCLQGEAGKLAGVTRAASQAFECMHNTLSVRVRVRYPVVRLTN